MDAQYIRVRCRCEKPQKIAGFHPQGLENTSIASIMHSR